MDHDHNGQILVDCYPYVYGTHDTVANNSLTEVFVRKRLDLGSPITANMFVVLRQRSNIYPQAAPRGEEHAKGVEEIKEYP